MTASGSMVITMLRRGIDNVVEDIENVTGVFRRWYKWCRESRTCQDGWFQEFWGKNLNGQIFDFLEFFRKC